MRADDLPVDYGRTKRRARLAPTVLLAGVKPQECAFREPQFVVEYVEQGVIHGQ